jgi:hypothetical protein
LGPFDHSRNLAGGHDESIGRRIRHGISEYQMSSMPILRFSIVHPAGG